MRPAPAARRGAARAGSSASSPPSSSATSESPPRPKVRMATASTMVRKPPTVAPSGSSRGRPLSSTATSVVVPPMSETTASSRPVMWRAPTRLAAGPDRIVSIGRCAGEGGRHQRAVAAHHHQRRRDAALLQKAFGRGDQPVDHRDQPGVEQRRQRAARAAELGRQFVAGGDRQAGLFADQVAGRDLVRRVAHGEIGADGKARDARRELGQRRLQRREVERGGIAMDVVAARHEQHRDRCRARPAARRGRGRPRKSRS